MSELIAWASGCGTADGMVTPDTLEYEFESSHAAIFKEKCFLSVVAKTKINKIGRGQEWPFLGIKNSACGRNCKEEFLWH